MPKKTSEKSGGLLASLTTLTATLVAIVHTRLDLLSLDVDEYRAHLSSLLVSALIAMFCITIGVVLATILVVVIFWDTHRLVALAALTGFFLAAGMAACGFIVYATRTKPRLFASSLAELRKDKQQLVSRL
jgi:uncharacterized membrane protein YqjE